MADIAIKIGVNAPSNDVEGVLKVLNIIYDQDPAEDEQPFQFSAYEEDFSDGAIGVLASMSFLLNYTGKDGTDKGFQTSKDHNGLFREYKLGTATDTGYYP